eukprot:gene26312-17406_t
MRDGLTGQKRPCVRVSVRVQRKKYSFPSDVWSCGVVMYAMLCGRFPFESHSDSKLAYKTVMHQRVNMVRGTWKTISQEAKDCISAMLERDTAKRPTAAQIMEMKWFRMEGVALNAPLERPVRMRLKEFASFSRFKQEVLRLVGAMMDDNSKAGFKRMYDRISGDKDLLYLEVAEAALLDSKMPQAEIDAVRSCIRVDDQGRMDFNEFIAITAAGASGVKMSGMLEQTTTQ